MRERMRISDKVARYIIPKAASGRYMGISTVATASSGIVAIASAL